MMTMAGNYLGLQFIPTALLSFTFERNYFPPSLHLTEKNGEQPTKVIGSENAQVVTGKRQATRDGAHTRLQNPGNARARALARPGTRPRLRPGPTRRAVGGRRGVGARTRAGWDRREPTCRRLRRCGRVTCRPAPAPPGPSLPGLWVCPKVRRWSCSVSCDSERSEPARRRLRTRA